MQVTFYELAQGAQPDSDTLIQKVVELVSHHYQKRQYLSVVCTNKAQAEELDEFIWQQPADKFIAHNLQGEGPVNGSPVEISWLDNIGKQPIRNKKLVINMSHEYLSQFAAYQHLIDFVPSDESLKKAARERYKEYKSAGCHMAFINAN
ncbi:DNA polymerase III subunit chi [Glaciecola siphonariae]|uniref:DNA polymerase III subunit chi n=1 Tax=Glaciecola siphonariae TaxID=521012 RepID=A0ABV9LZN6_9ALTE